MKTTLKFELPEEKEEFIMSLNGPTAHIVLYDMDQWLRKKMKYEDENMSEEVYSVYEECRNKLQSFLEENNITIN